MIHTRILLLRAHKCQPPGSVIGTTFITKIFNLTTIRILADFHDITSDSIPQKSIDLNEAKITRFTCPYTQAGIFKLLNVKIYMSNISQIISICNALSKKNSYAKKVVG